MDQRLPHRGGGMRTTASRLWIWQWSSNTRPSRDPLPGSNTPWQAGGRLQPATCCLP